MAARVFKPPEKTSIMKHYIIGGFLFSGKTVEFFNKKTRGEEMRLFHTLGISLCVLVLSACQTLTEPKKFKKIPVSGSMIVVPAFDVEGAPSVSVTARSQHYGREEFWKWTDSGLFAIDLAPGRYYPIDWDSPQALRNRVIKNAFFKKRAPAFSLKEVKTGQDANNNMFSYVVKAVDGKHCLTAMRTLRFAWGGDGGHGGVNPTGAYFILQTCVPSAHTSAEDFTDVALALMDGIKLKD